jgi:hypothetical protein
MEASKKKEAKRTTGREIVERNFCVCYMQPFASIPSHFTTTMLPLLLRTIHKKLLL